MFEKLFGKRPAAPQLPDPTPQHALGALLVRVALADRDYRASEVGAIDKVLSATFGLKPLEAAKFRAQCEALERHAPGTPEFAKILREAVPYEERLTLASAMWQVLLADGDHADTEEAMLHQIEAALDITPEDSAAIKAQALGD